MSQIESQYQSLLTGLKEKIWLAQQKAALAVNTQLLAVYGRSVISFCTSKKLKGGELK
jgi:hypothetical protein